MTDALRYAQKAAADMENWFGVKPRVNRHAQLVVTREQLTRLEKSVGPLYPSDNILPSSLAARLTGVPIVLELDDAEVQLLQPNRPESALQRRTRVRKTFRALLTLTALAVAVVAAGRIEADAALLEKVLLSVTACALLVLVYVANGRKA